MDEILMLEMPEAKPAVKKRGGKVKSVLRVKRDELWIGDILLDRRGRVWRHVDSIPPDIVLKAMAAFTRGEERGELVGRRCGLNYKWQVVGLEEEAVSARAELAEAA
jgi:hypothetical protein